MKKKYLNAKRYESKDVKEKELIDETLDYLKMVISMIEGRRVKKKEILIFLRQRTMYLCQKINKLGTCEPFG